MKRVLLYILLCISLAVFAQQQPGQDEVSGENQSQATDSAGQEEEDQPPEESEDTEPGDRDFKPSEEISEDYPVPLPSDI